MGILGTGNDIEPYPFLSVLVVSSRTVIMAGTHAAILEICSPNHTGMDHSTQLLQEFLIPMHHAESRASRSFRR